MRRSVALLLGVAGTASAQSAPGVLTAHGAAATVTAEVDASAGAFGDLASLAPNLSLGISSDLTLSLCDRCVRDDV